MNVPFLTPAAEIDPDTAKLEAADKVINECLEEIRMPPPDEPHNDEADQVIEEILEEIRKPPPDEPQEDELAPPAQGNLPHQNEPQEDESTPPAQGNLPHDSESHEKKDASTQKADKKQKKSAKNDKVKANRRARRKIVSSKTAKHNIFTHLPMNNPDCDICRRCKCTRAFCKSKCGPDPDGLPKLQHSRTTSQRTTRS